MKQDRSLGNKSLAVLDMIIDNFLELFAVAETWHDSAETSSVIASTPPEYQVFERSRPRRKSKAASLSTNHGGISMFVRAHIQVRKIDFPEYKAFELLPVYMYVRVGALSFAFVVVYRPDPASSITNDFFVNFADVLERTSSFAGCMIVDDVNLHLDTVSAHTT